MTAPTIDTRGAVCLWYCHCRKDPIATADHVTDPQAQKTAAAHARGEHGTKKASR